MAPALTQAFNPPTCVNSHVRRLLRRFATCLSVVALTTTCVLSQTPAVDPTTLAKYDANRNGRLDPEEIVEPTGNVPPEVVENAFRLGQSTQAKEPA